MLANQCKVFVPEHRPNSVQVGSPIGTQPDTMPSKRKETPASKTILEKVASYAAAKAVPLYHVGFVPFVIAVGFLFTEPRPHLVQLLSPM